jgi:hypothetical protein
MVPPKTNKKNKIEKGRENKENFISIFFLSIFPSGTTTSPQK